MSDKKPGKLEIRCQENWNICPQLRALPAVGHGATVSGLQRYRLGFSQFHAVGKGQSRSMFSFFLAALCSVFLSSHSLYVSGATVSGTAKIPVGVFPSSGVFPVGCSDCKIPAFRDCKDTCFQGLQDLQGRQRPWLIILHVVYSTIISGRSCPPRS